MKRKLLTFLIAGAIALSALPAVSAETEERVVTEYPDRIVTTLERGSITVYHSGLTVSEISLDHDGIFVVVCNSLVTNELLAQWVADGSIPRETAHIQGCGEMDCHHCMPWELAVTLTFEEQVEHLQQFSRTLSDLTPLSKLPNLREIALIDHNISDLSPLFGLKNLERLWLFGNPVTDLTPLSKLTNLKGLYLSGTEISDLSPLSGLTKLRNLFLEDCQITDVSALANLPNLWYLQLKNNPDLVVSSLGSLTNVDYIIWDGNPNELSGFELKRAFLKHGNPTIADALEILRFVVGLSSVVGECDDALAAALIISEDTPGVADALQILRHLVGLESVLD
jgi:hypothetical protein